MIEFDSIIKKSLSENISISDTDMDRSYLKFKESIGSNKRNNFNLMIFNYFGLKKAAITIALCLVCLCLLLVGTSSTVRAAALEVINNVKMIFVTERTGDEIKIVQKPSSEVMVQPFAHSYVRPNDDQVGNLLGYSVTFPNKLYNNYELKDELLFLSLNKEVPYDNTETLKRQMEAAILDEEEFNKLQKYEPFRSVMGKYTYTKPDEKYGTTFAITSYPTEIKLEDRLNKQEVMIGDMTGYWINVTYPAYPWMVNGEDPMTKKPDIKNDYNGLSWSLNSRSYALQVLGENNLKYITKDLAIELAKEFIAAQAN